MGIHSPESAPAAHDSEPTISSAKEPRDKGFRSGSPYGHCASFGNSKPRLGQNLSADHIRRADVALIVGGGDILSDGMSVVVERVCVDNGAVLAAKRPSATMFRSASTMRIISPS